MQIDPKIIEAIMSGQNVPGYFSNRTQGYWQNGYGPEAGGTYVQPEGADTWTISQPMGNNMVAEWLGDGTFRGINQDTSKDFSNGAALVQAAILAAAGGAAAGVGSGAAGSTLPATATSAYGGAAPMALPTMAEMGVGAATVTPELLATLPALEVGGAAAAGGALGASGGSPMAEGAFNPNGITDPNFGANASFGGTTSVGGLDGPIPANTGGASPWLKLAGAALGAYSSRDQTQTQSRDPWAPAQGWLKDLIGQGQTIGDQALKNPVGPRLGQAYNNLFGAVDAANANAGGWLDSMRANASGGNGYDRSNPRARRQNTTATAKPNIGWLAALGG